ncbi:MAG: tRNA (N6-threonylcarbamoyladenosine(37)-N6)-methyltransferase TrmO [Chromatiales bacterium]
MDLTPIGFVRSPFRADGPPIRRRDIVAEIEVRSEYAPALDGIQDWSHLLVLFWMQQVDRVRIPLTTHPRHRSDLPRVGVFASRGRDRPNPIGVAVVELLKRDGNVLTVQRLDAYDGTPVIDIKPYDHYDVVTDLRVPDWWAKLS